MIELDARDLPAPEPFQLGLSALMRLKKGEVIHLRHRMVPMLLIPRLKGYFYTIVEEDEVDLYICHKDDEDAICEIRETLR